MKRLHFVLKRSSIDARDLLLPKETGLKEFNFQTWFLYQTSVDTISLNSKFLLKITHE